MLLKMLQILLDWINDELADHRIIVKDIEEDLFDGQILQKLIGERKRASTASYFSFWPVPCCVSVCVFVCVCARARVCVVVVVEFYPEIPTKLTKTLIRNNFVPLCSNTVSIS